MSLPDDQQNAKPEPPASGSTHGPIVTLTFSDTHEGSPHAGKKEIVRINLPQPSAKPDTTNPPKAS